MRQFTESNAIGCHFIFKMLCFNYFTSGESDKVVFVAKYNSTFLSNRAGPMKLGPASWLSLDGR